MLILSYVGTCLHHWQPPICFFFFTIPLYPSLPPGKIRISSLLCHPSRPQWPYSHEGSSSKIKASHWCSHGWQCLRGGVGQKSQLYSFCQDGSWLCREALTPACASQPMRLRALIPRAGYNLDDDICHKSHEEAASEFLCLELLYFGKSFFLFPRFTSLCLFLLP